MKRWFVAVVFAALGFVSPGVFSQTIKKVEVTGVKRLNSQSVLQYVTQKEGAAFSRERVRDDLKTLYNTGLFKDVRIDVADVAGGLALTIVVVEKDYIQRVEFSGNGDVSKDDLQKALDLKPPFLWDENLIRSSGDKIRKLYRDKGYFLATLRPQVVEEGSVKVLRFEIDEGFQVEVRGIYIQGNKVLSDYQLKEAMISREGAFWKSFSRQNLYDQDLLVQIDTRRIQLEYLKRGYAFARVDAPSISFTADRSAVVVAYNVFEGDQYNVGDITFSGDLDFVNDPEALRRQLLSKKSEIWNIENIQADIQKIQDIYGDQGYAYANVSPSWNINPLDPKKLDIDFRIDKGTIVYFGSIDVTGNFETLDRVVRRELEISEGELFNITRYRESQKNLERLGYFEEVKFVQKDILAENKMDVVIEVKERQTGSLTLGASFSSFDRFGFQGAVSKVNLFGRGYDVNLSALLSARRTIFSAYFRDPRVMDSRYSLTLNAFNTQIQSVDETQITERGGSIGVGRPLNKIWRVDATYGIKDIGINIRDVIESYFPNSTGLDSSATFSITRDTLNVREIFLPSRGSLNQVSAQNSSQVLGSDLSYIQLNYTGKKYIEVLKPDAPLLGGSVLAFGFRADYLRGTEDRSTPYNERFIPGGINSIRGHLFRSLGPSIYTPINITGRRDDDGELSVTESQKLRLGGNKQLIFNVEYLFDIFREAKIKGVVFYDMGNTFEEKNYRFWHLRKSAGFGFRWFSPLGPLRFEWGIPLDRKPGEDNVLFDFSIGTPF